MTINLKAPELRELKPRIMVCGVGGAGGNAVNNMITSGLMVKVYDCDNPLKPEKDDILGEKLVSLDCLKYQNTSEFVEFLAGTEKDPKALPKGKVMLTVTWQPPPGAEDEDTSMKLLVGDERVRGSRPLIASDDH